MSYLQSYLRYASANEAPEIFHTWAAYFCLSTAVRRQVWMPFADDYIYPNIYVMFVGGAGNGKSEALRRAKRVLAELEIPMSASIETPEGLWRFMAGEPTAKPPVPSPVARLIRGPEGVVIEAHPFPIIANEFVNFIAPNPEGWINALNDIFDCGGYTYRTKNNGTDVLSNPYITLLGALTTEVSTTLHKQNIIGTGMGRRTLFQFGERKWHEPNPWPVMTEDEKCARAEAIAHLRQVQKVSGEFVMTAAARAWWDVWYRTNHAQVPKMLTNLKSWYGTKAARLMQLAMLTSLSEGLDLVVDVQHLEVPLAFLEVLEADLPKVFGGVGRNELAGVAQRILDYINTLSMPESKQSLKAKFFAECRPPTDFDDCIAYLESTEQIKTFDCQLGSQLQLLIAPPRVLAEHVVRVSGSAPATVTAPLLQWATALLANPPVAPIEATLALKPSADPDAASVVV